MPEQRKLVSILFADVVGSTALATENDPEVVRSVMARYFDVMREIAEVHGGTTEKFIGDAVMVAFGVPRLHDDDAERAVRAALAMRERLPRLNEELAAALMLRIGVNTGEVVANSDQEGHFLVTGDVVNVAARLQQGAEPGEVVVGELTRRLTRSAIEYRERTPLDAKGKAQPIVAFSAVRARTVRPEQVRGGVSAPLVGRTHELHLLREALLITREERQPRLVTIVGAAGIGKSRLVREALAESEVDPSVDVLHGRALPYGEGITYWPLVEIVRRDVGVAFGDGRDAVLAKLGGRLETLFVGERERQAVRARIAVLLGLESPSEAVPEVALESVASEIAWGIRRYLEAVAARRTTIVVIDDLQWASPAVHDVLEQTVELVRDAPLLVVCVARRELLDENPTWGAGKTNASLIALDSLSDAETVTLIDGLLDIDELPHELRLRIIERSGGNPLFCEEFVNMLVDRGDVRREGRRWRAATAAGGLVEVPETIQALLAARLDGLSREERAALQVASVVGERFGADQIATLAPSDDLSAVLTRLSRRGLLLEDRRSTETRGLRFKHLLIRDVAYASLPKVERASLHERFGLGLEAQVGDRRAEFVEILAYHAETAFALSRELRLRGEDLHRRADSVAGLAVLAAERSLGRQDAVTIFHWVEKGQAASDVLPQVGGSARQARLAYFQAEALRLAARYNEARPAAARAIQLAIDAAQPDLAAAAHLCAANVGHASGDYEQFRHEATEAARLYREAGNGAGEVQARFQQVLPLYAVEGKISAFIEQGLPLKARALEVGDRMTAAQLLAWMSMSAAFAGRKDEAEQFAGEATRLFEEFGIRDMVLSLAQACLGWLQGDLRKSEDHLVAGLAAAKERGTDVLWIQTCLAQTLVYARSFNDADGVLHAAVATSEQTGELHVRAWLYMLAAEVSLAHGDLELADDLAARSVACGAEAIDQRFCTELTVAINHTARGRHDEAEAAYIRALELIRSTELAAFQVDICLAYATFLVDRNRAAAALPLIMEAERFEFRHQEVAAMRRRAEAPPLLSDGRTS